MTTYNLREVSEIYTRHKVQPETIGNDVNTMAEFRKLHYAI